MRRNQCKTRQKLENIVHLSSSALMWLTLNKQQDRKRQLCASFLSTKKSIQEAEDHMDMLSIGAKRAETTNTNLAATDKAATRIIIQEEAEQAHQGRVYTCTVFCTDEAVENAANREKTRKSPKIEQEQLLRAGQDDGHGPLDTDAAKVGHHAEEKAETHLMNERSFLVHQSEAFRCKLALDVLGSSRCQEKTR